MKTTLVTLFAAAAIATSSTALAWGSEGHEIVCEIALQELTDDARQTVNEIMAAETDARFQTFRQSCGWPDFRGTAQNKRRADHYLNVPRNFTSIPNEDCPEANTCLFTAIDQEKSTLSDSSATAQDRLEALKFLGHWVGDIHQPLHVSYEDDRGGNDILLERGIGCRKKLHDVWDNCIPEDRMKESGNKKDREGQARLLHSQITATQRSSWTSNMTARSWANESYAITRMPGVEYCVLVGTVCQYTEEEREFVEADGEEFEEGGRIFIELTPAYEDMWGETVDTRLKQAGVRLGALLNDLLD